MRIHLNLRHEGATGAGTVPWAPPHGFAGFRLIQGMGLHHQKAHPQETQHTSKHTEKLIEIHIHSGGHQQRKNHHEVTTQSRAEETQTKRPHTTTAE